MFRQQVVIDSRLVIKTFQKSGGDKLDQIAIALSVFAEKHKMVVAALARFRGRAGVAVRGIALRCLAAIVAASLRDVHFASDDRFHAARFGRVIKRFRREKISVIGDGHSRHFPARGFVDDFFEVAGSIQQAVIRVQMQVNESGSFHAGGYSNLARRFWLRAISWHSEESLRGFCGYPRKAADCWSSTSHRWRVQISCMTTNYEFVDASVKIPTLAEIARIGHPRGIATPLTS